MALCRASVIRVPVRERPIAMFERAWSQAGVDRPSGSNNTPKSVRWLHEHSMVSDSSLYLSLVCRQPSVPHFWSALFQYAQWADGGLIILSLTSVVSMNATLSNVNLKLVM